MFGPPLEIQIPEDSESYKTLLKEFPQLAAKVIDHSKGLKVRAVVDLSQRHVENEGIFYYDLKMGTRLSDNTPCWRFSNYREPDEKIKWLYIDGQFLDE